MTHEITRIGSVEDPARCTGWNTAGILPSKLGMISSKSMMVLTVNDNHKAVHLTMDARSIHDMVRSLLTMAKTYAPIHDGQECPACEQAIPLLPDEEES